MNTFTASVLGRRRLSPHLVSISLEVGGDFVTTGVPDEYLRVLIAPEGAELALPEVDDDLRWVYPEGSVEPVARVYTVSDHRIVDGRVQIDVDVALHDVGAGSDWARTCAPGDRVGLTEPNGLYAAAPDVPWQLLVCDITGLSALARILRGLSPEQRVEAVVVLTDPADEVPLPSPAEVTIDWVVVDDERHVADAMSSAVLDRELPDQGRYVWLAGEARASRAVRKHLRRTLRWPQSDFYTCGYWQLDAEKWTARYEQVAEQVDAAAIEAYHQRQSDGDEGAYLDRLEDIYENAGL